MSQKNLRRRRKGAPRAMPVETIVTRFKSAQQKHKYEHKQYKSNKSKVQIRSIKQTKLQNQTTASIKNTIRQSVDEKANKSLEELKKLDRNEEYYPQKLRRSLPNKKIVLVPKSNHKIVGSLNSFNKRKLRKPNKEIIYQQTDMVYCTMDDDSEIFDKSQMSIIDNISIGSDSLDEEDLLEILTCPSPVWWEDGPEDYDEEPISVKDHVLDDSNTRKKPITKSNEMIREQTEFNKICVQKEQNYFTSNELAIDINNKDKNFVNRRNKLEVLLGNLKNKTVNVAEIGIVKNKDHSNTNNTSPVPGRQKRLSESCDEELIDENFDDILRSFENIDIPIKNTSPDITKMNIDEDTNSVVKSKLKFVSDMSPLINKQPVKGITIIKSDIRKFKPSKRNENPKKVGNDIPVKKDRMLVFKKISDYNMKVVKKNDKNIIMGKAETNTFSNKEHKPITGLTITNWDPKLTKASNKNLVTKVNKKIKFNNNKDGEISKMRDDLSTQSNNEKSVDPSLDHVTVYQIVCEQESNNEKSDSKLDLNIEYNCQLSSYYNQCKNINKNIKDTLNIRSKLVNSSADVNSAVVKSISESDNETVRYCLQCSSVFDTDVCKNCATKLQSKTEEHSKTVQVSEKL